MTFTTRLDHAQRLAVFYGQDTLSQKDLAHALKLFRNPDFPADYDLLNLFDPDIRLQLDHNAMVTHAIERQRTLLERAPDQQIRSAFVAVPASLKSLLEYWPLFFPEAENGLQIRFFDTQEEALAWLGRDPIDLDALEDVSIQPL
ncbi:hypothetical protein ACFELO_00340 [Oceanicaulis sp. LC35]|uniref:hypothetical protein n=1 Tax=Oceanicaulis sp. LC35 TaxID=3349635 RepID=UPI003F871F3C